MINPQLVTAELARDADRLEAAADETFGADTRPLRTILGVVVATMINRGGHTPTRAYVENMLRLMARYDDEAAPAAPAPAVAS